MNLASRRNKLSITSDFIIPIREYRPKWKLSGFICQEIPHTKLVKSAGITPNTLRTYFRDYQQGGIEKLKEINFYRPQSKLEEHRTSLEDYFCKNPPTSINEAVNRIEELTGIKRSPTQRAEISQINGDAMSESRSAPC